MVPAADGCYVVCDWRWCVSKSSCLSRDNHCDVAVIDGGRGGGEPPSLSPSNCWIFELVAFFSLQIVFSSHLSGT